MKSRAIKVFHYRDVPLEKEMVVEGVKEEVDNLVHSIVKNYKTKITAENIENGDVVTFRCESAMPKFNKPVLPVTVGKGLFDKEFEAAVLGMRTGEEKELALKDNSVKVKVLSISRTQYPPLTDAMIQEQITGRDEDYGEVKTADEYIRAAYRKEFQDKKEQAVYTVLNNICVEVFNNSTWAFDEDEISAYEKYVLDTETENLRQEGIDVSALKTEDDFIRAFGDIRNREELDDAVASVARDTIAMYLMACDWTNIDPETVDLYNEDAAPNITDRLCDYIRETVTFIEEK